MTRFKHCHDIQLPHLIYKFSIFDNAYKVNGHFVTDPVTFYCLAEESIDDMWVGAD
ncbi:hypothetical protein MH1LPH_27600 [Lactiplantibacillus brownii]